MHDKIVIKGAREHNLKNINLTIPRNKMVVFTGLSGSGKSSLAFDTIFAEGQRRYVESLSAYARQFLGKLDKPDVDEIQGLSPAISIDQKAHSANPRSTVATITEIYDYMRVLFSRIGKPFCPMCGTEIRRMTATQIVDAIIGHIDEKKSKTQTMILAPLVRGRKGEYYQLLYDMLGAGFSEARIDGEIKSLRGRIEMERYKQHTIELIVDKIVAGTDLHDKENRTRLAEAVETALRRGDDVVTVVFGKDEEVHFSAASSCPRDNFAFPEIEPRLFSFNSPFGACKVCHGLGVKDIFSEEICEACAGKRLCPEALSILIDGKNIAEVAALSIDGAYEFFYTKPLAWDAKEKEIAELPLREILNRLGFMIDVGLNYLTLDRKAGTLSGGEAQRIRLASQIGSQLVGALYVLDEPTIGLHQRDNDRLIATLKHLRDIGNTIIVVEHDEDTIRAADHFVEIGPGAGVHGGKVVAQGGVPEILKDKKQTSLTLEYLRGEKKIQVPNKRRAATGPFIKLRGVTQNNLKDINVDIPFQTMTAITGVSGSGKSTLIYDVLYRALANRFNHSNYKVTGYKTVLGLEYINRVINVDQSAIGRTPRSNPATYIGAWTHIRDLFAMTEDARIRGWNAGRFSFNVKGGRCEQCEGYGYTSIEMHFLPEVQVTCDACKGKRYSDETLEVRYRDKNIYDVLKMTIEEAAKFFKDIPWLKEKMDIMCEVGLGYLEIGQSATTLSGGEAQRVKLAAELGKRDTRRTLYLLDEPTTGLHFDDIRKLLEVLQRLVDRGNSVVVIEHNLDVIKTCDWVIDLGPEGGDKGGEVLVAGTPEDVVRCGKSYTGKYLRHVLPQ